jgi:hypothetical protein
MDWSLSDAFSPGKAPATPLAAGTLGAGGGLFGDGITKRSGGNEFRIVSLDVSEQGRAFCGDVGLEFTRRSKPI